MQEDLYYPRSFLQDLFWKSVHMFSESILDRWPLNKLIRQRALQSTMALIHYHDESTRYITGGCLPKVVVVIVLFCYSSRNKLSN